MIFSVVVSPATKETARTRSSDENGMIRKRWNTPTSLTLHEQTCAMRSRALVLECQFFTFPWGNPREAQPSRQFDQTGLECSAADE
ncbi:MAG: hypothetical protein DMG96_07755 [Acidobacteria bacterium]|nr:MAG: hypothetical protein DMG96_07755 [Acidobacteriota bacterium]